MKWLDKFLFGGPSVNFMKHANRFVLTFWALFMAYEIYEFYSCLQDVLRQVPSGTERNKAIADEIVKHLMVGMALPGIIYFYMNGYSIHAVSQFAGRGWQLKPAKNKKTKNVDDQQ